MSNVSLIVFLVIIVLFSLMVLHVSKRLLDIRQAAMDDEKTKQKGPREPVDDEWNPLI